MNYLSLVLDRVVALPSFSQFMSEITEGMAPRSIDFLLREVGKLTFEAVLAHPEFKAEWERLLEPNRVIRYEFFSGQDCSFGYSYRLTRLREFVSYATAACDGLNLQREVSLHQHKNYSKHYHLHGWLQGPVSNALAGFFYLRARGKPINLDGTLFQKLQLSENTS